MSSLGFTALAMAFAALPLSHAAATDSAPDQQQWRDVPHAQLNVPDGDARRDRAERHYDGDYRDDGSLLPPPEYGADYSYDDATGGIEGTWEGTWNGQYDDGRPYSYSGSFDGEYRPAGAPYPAPYDAVPPHHAPGHNPTILHHGSQVIINGVAYPAGGTVSNGYYYPTATTTTITVHSGCCQHAEAAAVWKAKPKKHWKPKPRTKIIRMTK